MSQTVSPTMRLRLNSAALITNWRALDGVSGPASTGAAIKANGYGLGAIKITELLAGAGCKDFFVASWQEAADIQQMSNDINISVLNGIRQNDFDLIPAINAKPVLNSQRQVELWKKIGKGPCDVMVDTGMNRLGITIQNVSDGILDGLDIDIFMSHLACADEESPMNTAQLNRFLALQSQVKAKRTSMANSAGIMLGSDWHFDLTRPGVSLYGGIVHPKHADIIQQVATPEAQILQRRTLNPGESVGYGATFVAEKDMEIATIGMGYADGYLGGFSNKGAFEHDGQTLPVLGRVSMDLISVDVTQQPHLSEGDWVECQYGLEAASERSGLSQYELLTNLSERFERYWI